MVNSRTRKLLFYYLSRFFQSVFLITVIQVVNAQVSIRGKVTDEKKESPGPVVVSLRQGDHLISSTITDSTGYYRFTNILKGDYKLLFKNIGYRDTMVLATINRDTLLNLQFQHIQMLPEAVVRARKPIFKMEIDRLRFNVGETDLVFGSNIWDIIEKTPLVTASEDGTIQISGTSGAIVYMNNKRKVLAGTALKDYLSSIPADNLEAIEVITTPSSKYDAEGGAGIINIVTKKNKEEGLIGNAVVSSRQTAVNSQAGSIYLNDRKGKWDVYSSLYFGDRSRKPELSKDIYYPYVSDTDLIHRSIHSYNDFRVLYPGMNLGIDHQINQNHVVGLLLDYSGNWHTETRNAFSHDYYQNSDSLTLTNNKDDLSSQTYSLNLNYQGKLDSSGRKLSIDFDALEYRSANNSASKTEALEVTTKLPLYDEDWFRSSSPQKVSNQSLKIDFEWPVKKNVSFDFGAKVSFSRIDNNLLFENRISDSVWAYDSSRSNVFRYDENINSLYAIFNRKINEKWAFQIGVRMENTIAKGWLEGVQVVDRNYTNVFPTSFLKYVAGKENTYVLAVTSRITRPTYWDVNPFRTYTTDQTYFEGNPFLSPSKYYRQELSHSLSGKTGTYTIQFAASQTIDEIYALPFNPSGNIIVNEKVNYGNKYGYSNTIIYYNQLLPWWRLSGSVLTGYVISKGAYGGDVLIDNKSLLSSISTNQTFNISRKKGLTCTVIATNTFPVTIVNTHIGNRLETEVRVRKSAGPFNLTLSAQDLFKSNKDRYKISVNDLTIMDVNYYDTRSVAFSLSYNFGKSTVKEKRDREAGYEDVKQRIM
jgi:outer membrane beta-barrel protein/carboxypeptidase family protein